MAAITSARSGLASATSTWTGGVVPGTVFGGTRTTTGAAVAVGATSIPVAAGAQVVTAGRMIRVAGDPNWYRVATGVAGGSAGNIVLGPYGLRQAIPASATTISVDLVDDKVTVAKPGTAVARTLSGAISSGATSIPVSAGTGTIVVGEVIQFDGSETWHEVTGPGAVGVTALSTGAGSITISPGAPSARASGATLRNRGHMVTVDGYVCWGDDTSTGVNVNGVMSFSRSVATWLVARGHVNRYAGSSWDQGHAEAGTPIPFESVVEVNNSVTLGNNKWGFLNYNGNRCRMAGNPSAVWETTSTQSRVSADTTITVADASSFVAGGHCAIVNEANGYVRISTVQSKSGSQLTLTDNMGAVLPSGVRVLNLWRNVRVDFCHPGNLDFNAGSNNLTGDFSLSDMAAYPSINIGNGQAFNFGNYGAELAVVATRCCFGVRTWVDGLFAGHTWLEGGRFPAITTSCVFFTVSDSAANLIGPHVDVGSWFITTWANPLASRGVSERSGRSISMTGSKVAGTSWNFATGYGMFSLSMVSVGLFRDNAGSPRSFSIGSEVSSGIDLGYARLNSNTPGIGNGAIGFARLSDCRFYVNSLANQTNWGQFPSFYAENLFATIKPVSGPDVVLHERIENSGFYTSATDQLRNSPSSLKFVNKVAGKALTRTVTLPIPAQSTRVLKVVGRRNAAYGAGSMPTVSVAGADATVTTAFADVADTWHEATLTVVNSASVAKLLTVTYTATGSTTGACWFGGVPDYPYVQAARWYGFVFDEANPFRGVDSTITLTESAAGAVTGVAINHTAQTITITAARTAADVYCFAMLDLVNNLDASGNYRTRHITSSDGASFSTTYTVIIGSGGSISGRYSDANGSVVSITLTNLIAGSNVRIVRTDTNVELAKANAPGTTFSINVTTASAFPVSIVAIPPMTGPTFAQPWTTTGTVDPTAGLTLAAAQLPD